MSGSRALSLTAILTACIAYGAGMGLTLPLLSLILERTGTPGAVNGLNLATGGFAALAVTPFMPRWIATLGAPRFMAIALCTAALALVTIYFVPSLWLWFPVRFVLSSGLNALFVVSEFWINQLATEKTRGRYVALYSMCVAGSFGIGPTVLQVIGTHGFAPFGLGAIMLLLALVPVMAARHTAPRIEPGEHHSVFGVLRFAPVAFAASFVFGAIDAGMAGLMPVYAVRSGYGEAAAALTVTAIALGSIALQYPIGWLSDRMDRRVLLMLCASTSIVGAALTPLVVHAPYLFYLLLFVWGGLVLGMYSVGLTLLGQQFQGRVLVNANAAFVMSYSAGLLFGPAAEGLALDAWNPHGLLAALAAISIVYIGVLAVRRR